jgi:NAD(P)H-hydrate repair Nnr-like enzyme with NAD(P)H-hydrate epimerase domain
MLLLTGSELTKAEQAAEKDLSVLQMMENAGRALAGHLIQYHSDKRTFFSAVKGKTAATG